MIEMIQRCMICHYIQTCRRPKMNNKNRRRDLWMLRAAEQRYIIHIVWWWWFLIWCPMWNKPRSSWCYLHVWDLADLRAGSVLAYGSSTVLYRPHWCLLDFGEARSSGIVELTVDDEIGNTAPHSSSVHFLLNQWFSYHNFKVWQTIKVPNQ